MGEWENPNPIMLSERAAQRSAAQSRAEHRAACIGPKANVPEVPLLHVQCVPGSVLWAGSARQDSLWPAAIAQDQGISLTGVFRDGLFTSKWKAPFRSPEKLALSSIREAIARNDKLKMMI